jgi:carbon-monoxide dehydrogenase small subunit
LLAVQADGAELITVEGLASPDGTLHPIQQAYREKHGLQCGFCTPGFLMTTYELLQTNPHPSVDEIKDWLSGNLCRCTGYQAILESVQLAAERLRGEDAIVAATPDTTTPPLAITAQPTPGRVEAQRSAAGGE